uniref:Uncharacterized protein n=1 Tax=Sus scrofa TaxID=9823 RepID=A0A8D1CRS4_PIG
MSQGYLIFGGVILKVFSYAIISSNLSSTRAVKKAEIFYHLQEFLQKLPSFLCLSQRLETKTPWKGELFQKYQKSKGTQFCYINLQGVGSVFSRYKFRFAWNT